MDADDEPVTADPVQTLAGLRQPDARSCGATTVVAWRILTDPAYAVRVRGLEATSVLATHRALTEVRDEAGHLQVPWPRALGTPPWAVARAIGGRVVAPRWEHLTAGLARAPVALYVGSRWLPLHVVMAVDRAGEAVRCHDPARGSAVVLTRDAFERAALPFTGRPRPWWLVRSTGQG